MPAPKKKTQPDVDLFKDQVEQVKFLEAKNAKNRKNDVRYYDVPLKRKYPPRTPSRSRTPLRRKTHISDGKVREPDGHIRELLLEYPTITRFPNITQKESKAYGSLLELIEHDKLLIDDKIEHDKWMSHQ